MQGIKFRGYDNWRLSNGEDERVVNEDLFECDACDSYTREEDFEEVTYRDADGDKQTKFLCECCQEKAMMGEL